MKMRTHTLKKSHFGDRIVILSDGSVSNGLWAMRKSAIANADVFVNPDTAGAAMGIRDARSTRSIFETIATSGEIHEWTPTHFCQVDLHIRVRIFQSTKTGKFAGVDVKILAVAGLEEKSIYGVDPAQPFMDANTVEKATFIAMPYRIYPFPVVEEPTR